LAFGCLGTGGIGLQAQTTYTISGPNLSNETFRLYGPNLTDITFSPATGATVNLQSSSTYYLEVNPGPNLASTLEIVVGSKGNIQPLSWMDADGSQTGGVYETYPTNFYTLEGDLLEFQVGKSSIDRVHTSLSGIVIPAVQSAPFTLDAFSVNLLPGDYILELGEADDGYGVSKLKTEITASTKWGGNVQWQPAKAFGGQVPTWQTLGGSYYEASENLLTLNGAAIDIVYNLGNALIRLENYGMDVSNNAAVYLMPGNLDMTVGAGSGIAARTQSLFQASGSLKDTTYWTDGDTSQANGAMLSAGYIVPGNDKITLNGSIMNWNLTASDHSIAVPALNVVKSGYFEYELFPGDYEIEVLNTTTLITLEVRDDGNMNPKPRYRDTYDPEIPEDELSPRYYSRTGNTFALTGKEFVFDLTNLPNETLEMVQIDPSQSSLSAGTANTRSLLPAGYRIPMTLFKQSAPAYSTFFRISNAEGGILGQTAYNDLTAGGNAYLPDGPYPPEQIYARKGGITWYGMPLAAATKYGDQFALLKRSPDGAWYTLPDRTLHFQYSGEYSGVDTDNDGNDDLAFKILDWKRDDKATSLALNKEYGDNRYSVALPQGTFPAGHYTLEVTSEKNETYYLRFKIQ